MKFVLIGFVWLLGAIALGASGALQRVRPPAPQLILFGLTAGLLAAYWFNAGFRDWLRALNLRAVVALHLSRFVGFYFLFLYGRGELPFGFAVPGGWGDIAVAVAAGILLAGWERLARNSRWLLAWNALGFADILLVVASATKHAIADPASMGALLKLPLSLLPTFLVPLIIASHILIFARSRSTEYGRTT